MGQDSLFHIVVHNRAQTGHGTFLFGCGHGFQHAVHQLTPLLGSKTAGITGQNVGADRQPAFSEFTGKGTVAAQGQGIRGHVKESFRIFVAKLPNICGGKGDKVMAQAEHLTHGEASLFGAAAAEGSQETGHNLQPGQCPEPTTADS